MQQKRSHQTRDTYYVIVLNCCSCFALFSNSFFHKRQGVTTGAGFCAFVIPWLADLGDVSPDPGPAE